MPRKYRDAGGWLGLLDLPQPNLSIRAATSQQVSIRAPGHRMQLTRMRQRLQLRATLQVPEDHCIIPTGGKQASIGGKGQVVGAGGLPGCPEQSATLQIPPLDTAIMAHGGHAASIGTDREGNH